MKMTKAYFLITTLIMIRLTITSAQPDKVNETKDDLSMPLNRNAGEASKSIVIHQEIDFTASPQRIYEALLDAKQFAEFSGRPAEIDRKVGGAFTLFDGHITGRNVELVPNKRIVQAWRTADWPEGTYSIAKFDLKQQGSGTHLVFDHIGFPEGLRDHLAQGWEGHYWELLKKYLH